MYRLTLITVGKLKNAHLRALCEDYLERLKRGGKVDVIEFKDSDPETEGARIIEALKGRDDANVWALAEEGSTMRSVDLAQAIDFQMGAELVFVIGGPYGLSKAVKKHASGLFSLSPMTFTHEMARYLLLEQLYRGVSINAGSKYHHE